MNTLTTNCNPQPRLAAYKADLFAEIDDLEARLEAKKIKNTLLVMLTVLSLTLCAWLLFIVMIVHGVDFSGFSVNTPLHQLTQQEIIKFYCPKNEHSLQKIMRPASRDHEGN